MVANASHGRSSLWVLLLLRRLRGPSGLSPATKEPRSPVFDYFDLFQSVIVPLRVHLRCSRAACRLTLRSIAVPALVACCPRVTLVWRAGSPDKCIAVLHVHAKVCARSCLGRPRLWGTISARTVDNPEGVGYSRRSLFATTASPALLDPT